MVVERTEEGVRWSRGKKSLAIALADVISTLEDLKRERLYVLHRDARGEWLSAFEPNGSRVFEVQAPTGSRFGYLVAHPIQGPAVVMQGDAMVDGWYDWHYSIGGDGQLTRGSPAY